MYIHMYTSVCWSVECVVVCVLGGGGTCTCELICYPMSRLELKELGIYSLALGCSVCLLLSHAHVCVLILYYT